MERDVYTGEFHAKDILPAPDCRIILSTKKIIPKGKQRYRIVLEWLEGKSGKVYINQRSNEYIDTYEGVLTVNGKERMNDLYLQVYREYPEKWCSRKAGFVICGGIFASALFLYLWLYTGGELGRILYAVRRTRHKMRTMAAVKINRKEDI